MISSYVLDLLLVRLVFGLGDCAISVKFGPVRSNRLKAQGLDSDRRLLKWTGLFSPDSLSRVQNSLQIILRLISVLAEKLCAPRDPENERQIVRCLSPDLYASDSSAFPHLYRMIHQTKARIQIACAISRFKKFPNSINYLGY